MKYPSCDKEGSIDVRLLSSKNEFKDYYTLRSKFLLAKDIDRHPESFDIHQAMFKIFETNQNITEKIASVI